VRSVAKVIKTNDDAPTIFGTSGAASFLGCCSASVYKYVDRGRLPCTRDSSGKRLFKLADLQKFKRENLVGNRAVNSPVGDSRSIRSAQS
jgi:hypothetical protein